MSLDALYLGFGVGDIVNDCGWAAGYTGTMLNRGQPVRYAFNALPGDAVICGGGWPGHHTAIVVRCGGTPMVVWHGSESGPHYLAYNQMGQNIMFHAHPALHHRAIRSTGAAAR